MTYAEHPYYKITSSTMALTQARHPHYRTIIHDLNGTYYTDKTMTTLLDQRCHDSGSDMRGRISATNKRLRIRNKTPLLLDSITPLVAFPTHSSTHIDNQWYFLPHIDQFHPENKHVIIHLTNGHTLHAHCSFETFQTQKRIASELFVEQCFKTLVTYESPLKRPLFFHS